jgi:hypothetical protein
MVIQLTLVQIVLNEPVRWIMHGLALLSIQIIFIHMSSVRTKVSVIDRQENVNVSLVTMGSLVVVRPVRMIVMGVGSAGLNAC